MATKPTKTATPSRSQRSKAQVQQEFGEIRQETEAAREAASAKSVEIEQRQAAEVRHTMNSRFWFCRKMPKRSARWRRSRLPGCKRR